MAGLLYSALEDSSNVVVKNTVIMIYACRFHGKYVDL
jgi:hypothetical protein